MRQWHGSVVATVAIWPADPKIFTIWTFAESDCWSVNCFKLGGQEKPLEMNMYYDMDVRGKSFLFHIIWVVLEHFALENSSHNHSASSVPPEKKKERKINGIFQPSCIQKPSFQNIEMLAPPGIFPGSIWKHGEELLLEHHGWAFAANDCMCYFDFRPSDGFFRVLCRRVWAEGNSSSLPEVGWVINRM